ncbi:hypothetical protein HNY73_008540 [Argiope bruennichi]|uniref:Uncharacterized protein n=1 Tax=Argiope bruennichi TaxID=94029 RepID=A0A8T0F945_ARGBR|nr:hypothetical protein HNY73_008540 [Argiope bruennichi]
MITEVREGQCLVYLKDLRYGGLLDLCIVEEEACKRRSKFQGGASFAFPGAQRRAPGDTDSCKGTGKGVLSRVDPPERQSSMNSESNLWKTEGLRKGSASAGNDEAMHLEACKGLRRKACPYLRDFDTEIGV